MNPFDDCTKNKCSHYRDDGNGCTHNQRGYFACPVRERDEKIHELHFDQFSKKHVDEAVRSAVKFHNVPEQELRKVIASYGTSPELVVWLDIVAWNLNLRRVRDKIPEAVAAFNKVIREAVK